MGVNIKPCEVSSSLRSITIHLGATAIPEEFFVQCCLLERLELPDSIREIGENAFCDCTSLERINIPAWLEKIPAQCFSKCTSLSQVTMGVNIKPSELSNRIKRIAIYSGVTVIPGRFFADCCSLEALELPDSIREIGEEAFCGCSSLEGINIPSKVQVIPARCFKGCSAIKAVVLSEGIREVGDWAFSECTGLSNLTYYGNSEISNNIGLPDGAVVYVSKDYPFAVFSGKSVVRIGVPSATASAAKKSLKISKGALAGIGSGCGLFLVEAICYFFCPERTEDPDFIQIIP